MESGERIKLDFEPDQNIQTLRQAIDYLKVSSHNPETHFYQFEIDANQYPIQAEDIRELTSFPYEFALNERNGNVVVNTLRSREGGSDVLELHFRRDYSGLSMHTHGRHLSISGESVPVTAPSFLDVYSVGYVTKSELLVLAHPEGLMIYQVPKWNPVTNSPFSGDPRNLMLKYGINYGIDLFGDDESLKDFDDLTEADKVAFQLSFAKDTHMIVDEAPWDDSIGVQRIMDVVNLRPYTPPPRSPISSSAKW